MSKALLPLILAASFLHPTSENKYYYKRKEFAPHFTDKEKEKLLNLSGKDKKRYLKKLKDKYYKLYFDSLPMEKKDGSIR